MRLNLDCVRDLLLTLEEHLIIDNEKNIHLLYLDDVQKMELMKRHTCSDIVYCSLKLIEAGLVVASVYKNREYVGDILFETLTYQGHIYLDSIRNKDIWEKAKIKIKKIGELSSLKIVSAVAEKLLIQSLGL